MYACSLSWSGAYPRLQSGHPHMNTGETGFLARVSINVRRRTLLPPKTPEEFQSPSVGREDSVRRRTLSSPHSGTSKKRDPQHESCYLRRLRRATGLDFCSAPRLRGRDPRSDAAAAAETSHSRPTFLHAMASARHSLAMWVGVHPARAAASTVVTMSSMSSIVAIRLSLTRQQRFFPAEKRESKTISSDDLGVAWAASGPQIQPACGSTDC